MTTLPYHNAYLTAVKGGGFSENYGAAEGSQPTKWSGEAQALVLDELATLVSGDRLDQVRQTVISLPANLGIAIDDGDTVEYTEDGVARSRKVRDLIAHPQFGLLKIRLYDALQ